jgi:hypothetical protein
VATPAKKPSLEPRKAKNDVPWLARLTHPLVFFGAALAVYEGTIGTALLVGKHSDQTVLWLCVLMAVVILAAMGLVAILIFKTPQHLMLNQQDTIGEGIRIARRVRDATRVLMEAEKPKTPTELFDLMAKIEAVLSEEGE